MSKPSLQIVIPKQEYNLNALIKRLRQLETPAYRSTVSEDWRVQERAEITRQFRQALKHQSIFSSFIDQVPDTIVNYYD